MEQDFGMHIAFSKYNTHDTKCVINSLVLDMQPMSFSVSVMVSRSSY